MTTEAATKAANQARVALVTGAANGIGLAITRRLLEAGMTVTALDANAAVHEILADQPALLSQLTTRQVDLRSDQAIQAMVEEALKAHGKIDIRASGIAASAAGRKRGSGRGGRLSNATGKRRRAKRNAMTKADATGNGSNAGNRQSQRQLLNLRG